MAKCGIYMIKNKINNKVYIGQSVDIERRWEAHKWRCVNDDKHLYLYNAINKYGIENFSFDVVELCDRDELNEKEIYYIKKYHSYIYDEKPNGYNMTIGGQESLSGKKIPVFCLTNGIAYDSLVLASEELGVPAKLISRYCKKHQTHTQNKVSFAGAKRKYAYDFCYVKNLGDILEKRGQGSPRKAVIAVPSMKIYPSKNYLEVKNITNRNAVLTIDDFINKLCNKKYWHKERYILLEDFLKIFQSTDIDFMEYIERNFN